MLLSSIVSILLLFVHHAVARHAFHAGTNSVHRHEKLQKRQSPSQLAKEYPQRKFTMPIDHFHNKSQYAPHSDGTFEQFYWFDDTYYRNGGPVIVNAMGEDSSFDLQWFQNGLLQQLANATGGMAVLWPQRYYSGGMPVNVTDYTFTTEELRFHSTEQAMADLAYFAQRVSFANHTQQNLTAPGTPWIVIGGSYAGVISAFSRIQYPDLFWGGIQSSGVSVAVIDNWQYYDQPRRYGPPACTQMQQKLINIVDNIMTSGNAQHIQQLKAAFNATTLTSNTDFVNVLSYPFNTDWEGSLFWQPGSITPFTGPGSYCGNITSATLVQPVTASASDRAKSIIQNGGWGNESASLLNPFLNYVHTIRDTYLFGVCPPPLTLNTCWSNHQASPFDYLGCIEAGQFPTGYVPGAPGHPPFLPTASRLLNVKYFLDNCRRTYNFSSNWQGPDVNTYNKYGAFNMSYNRLLLTTGEYDIYRPITPLAANLTDYGVPNPRVNSNGTADSPQRVISMGGHEWDLQDIPHREYNSTTPPPQVRSVKNLEIETVQRWLQEWHTQHNSTTGSY